MLIKEPAAERKGKRMAVFRVSGAEKRQRREKEVQDYGLQRIHEANLEILKAVDRLCRRHHIDYRIDSGTLLGAVRHRGFVPWDDDADLCFRREDFERFRKVAGELPETMKLLMPDEFRGGSVFYDYVPRILYLPSRRFSADDPMQEFYEGKLNHLWVDLFLLDRLPDQPLLSRWYRLRQQILFGLGMGHRLSLDKKKYHGRNRLFVSVLAGIGKRIPMQKLFYLQDKLARTETERQRNSGKQSRESYFSNYQPDFQYCVVQNSWEEPVMEYHFADTSLLGPRNWDEILRMLYGAYRKLPPAEKRVPSHGSRQMKVFTAEEYRRDRETMV